MKARVIMLVDFDYFFAQCEEKRNPSIKEKPVVVCVYSGRSVDSGAVSTANYIARKYGVKSGIPIYLAKKRLKETDAVFLPMDRGFYEQVSNKIMDILRSYADLFERVGIDEAYLDVSHRVDGDFEEAKELAERIMDDVKAREGIACSIGIGPNKLIAKIASNIKKPEGLTVVKPDAVEDFLSPMPVGRIIGVGAKTEDKMEHLGIKTVGDLAKCDVQKLAETFGRNLGTYFHQAAFGIDDAPIQERSGVESISRISTLKEDTQNLEIILDKVRQLCEEVHAKLLQRGLSFKSVAVVAIMTDMSTRNRSKTLESPTNELSVLKENARELFEKLLEESELKIRRVGVKLANLVEGQKTQKQITDFTGKV